MASFVTSALNQRRFSRFNIVAVLFEVFVVNTELPCIYLFSLILAILRLCMQKHRA